MQCGNITQEALASKINRSREFLAKIEKGAEHPSVATLVDIADALCISVDDLLLDSLHYSVSTSNTELHRLLLDCNETEQEIIIRTARELKATLVSLEFNIHLHQAFHNIEHFIIITVVVCFCYGYIILVYKKNYRLCIIALHHRCQKHKAVLNFFYRTIAMCKMLKRCFLEFCSTFTIKQIKMFVVQIRYHHCEHIVCPSEIQTVYLPE